MALMAVSFTVWRDNASAGVTAHVRIARRSGTETKMQPISFASMQNATTTTAPVTTTILILEPDVLVRISISEYLRLCGYKVIEG